MKKIITFIFLCSISFAYGEACTAPQIKEINLNYKESNDQSLYFGGRYLININPSKKAIFSSGMLAYIYNDQKHFVLHADTEIKEENKNEILQAFGLNNDKSASPFRMGLGLCSGTITQYKVEGMPETIIAVESTVLDKPSIMIYLFNEVSPFVERIQFLGFSNDEIEQTLSTLKNTTRK